MCDTKKLDLIYEQEMACRETEGHVSDENSSVLRGAFSLSVVLCDGSCLELSSAT